MDKDHTKRYRPSAAELALEARLMALTHVLQNFAARVRMNLPNVGDLDMGMLNCAPGIMMGQISDQGMIDGHGPRFVAKYHLAASDEERRTLLETLPQVGGYDSRLIWADLVGLTAEARLGYQGDAQVSPQWVDWYERVMDPETIRPVVLDGTLQDIASAVTTWSSTGDPCIADSFDCVRFKTSETERKDGYRDSVKVPATDTLYAVMGIAELNVYVLVSHVKSTYNNRNTRVAPRFEKCIWWNRHEQCWNTTEVNFNASYQEAITRRYLKYTMMPDFDYVSLDEMAVMGKALLDHLTANGDWYKSAQAYGNPTKQTTVTLPGVLRFRFRRSNYGDGDVMYPLYQGNQYPPEWPIAYKFDREWDRLPLYGQDEHKYIKTSLPILPYARREAFDAIYQFINADPSQLVIVHEGGESDDDDDN